MWIEKAKKILLIAIASILACMLIDGAVIQLLAQADRSGWQAAKIVRITVILSMSTYPHVEFRGEKIPNNVELCLPA